MARVVKWTCVIRASGMPNRKVSDGCSTIISFLMESMGAVIENERCPLLDI